jgi:hypothetical protein
VTNLPQHNWRSVVVALALALAAAGCAMTFDATSLGVPASLASSAAQPVVGDTFNVRTKSVYLFWGLFQSVSPSLLNVLQGQVAGGRAVQSLRVRVSRRWSDVLITALTAGVVTPVTVQFQGVVVPGSP